MHALKTSSPDYLGFGEAYFSCVEQGAVRGWKKHTRMTLNLVVVVGEIRFVVFDNTMIEVAAYNLGPGSDETYQRLTVPPGYWLAFGGAAPGESILLNLADIEHDPDEAVTLSLDKMAWSWR